MPARMWLKPTMPRSAPLRKVLQAVSSETEVSCLAFRVATSGEERNAPWGGIRKFAHRCILRLLSRKQEGVEGGLRESYRWVGSVSGGGEVVG